MNPLRKLRWIVGLGALAYVLIDGCRTETRNPDNDATREKIRQAADIVRMWKDGVWSSRVPNLKPSLARRLLREAVDSKSEEQLKAEARRLLAELDRKPHYFAFAEGIVGFLPHVGEYLALFDPAGAGAVLGELPSRKLVVLSKQSPADRDGGQAGAYFDAEMIEACGDRVALSPGDVGAVIVLESEREVIGNYEARGMIIGGRRIDFGEPGAGDGTRRVVRPQPYVVGPAYREICAVTAREFPSGRLVERRLLEAADPRERLSGRGAGSTPSALEQIRLELADYLAGLAGDGP